MITQLERIEYDEWLKANSKTNSFNSADLFLISKYGQNNRKYVGKASVLSDEKEPWWYY